MKEFIKQTIARWKAKTPIYFKKILTWSISILTALVAGYTSMVAAGVSIPVWLSTIYPYAVGFSAGLASLSKVTQTYHDQEGQQG